MLVLLHFYRLGYSPFTLAFLFLLYEAAGVLANLVGGWLATMFGFGGNISGFDLHSFLVAVVGAIVVLGIFRLLRRA